MKFQSWPDCLAPRPRWSRDLRCGSIPGRILSPACRNSAWRGVYASGAQGTQHRPPRVLVRVIGSTLAGVASNWTRPSVSPCGYGYASRSWLTWSPPEEKAIGPCGSAMSPGSPAKGPCQGPVIDAQGDPRSYPVAPWQRLNFLPDPHGHSAFLPTTGTTGLAEEEPGAGGSAPGCDSRDIGPFPG